MSGLPNAPTSGIHDLTSGLRSKMNPLQQCVLSLPRVSSVPIEVIRNLYKTTVVVRAGFVLRFQSLFLEGYATKKCKYGWQWFLHSLQFLKVFRWFKTFKYPKTPKRDKSYLQTESMIYQIKTKTMAERRTVQFSITIVWYAWEVVGVVIPQIIFLFHRYRLQEEDIPI